MRNAVIYDNMRTLSLYLHQCAPMPVPHSEHESPCLHPAGSPYAQRLLPGRVCRHAYTRAQLGEWDPTRGCDERVAAFVSRFSRGDAVHRRTFTHTIYHLLVSVWFAALPRL